MKNFRAKKSKKIKEVFFDGMERTAAAIAKEFSMNCTRQTLNFWKKLDPPFPAPTNGNRYSRAQCFEWVRNYKGVKEESQQASLALHAQAFTSKNQKLITEAEREAWEFEQLKGRFIDRNEARALTQAALLKYHGFVRLEVERSGPLERKNKLAQFGLTPEQVAEFYAFDIASEQARFDRICDRCERETKEPDAITI